MTWLDANIPGLCIPNSVEGYLQGGHVRIYQNPFNGDFNISFHLAHQGKVTVEIFDLAGRTVYSKMEEVRSAGSQELTINHAQLSAGTYLLKIRMDDATHFHKIVAQ
jgi:hypothetical protein